MNLYNCLIHLILLTIFAKAELNAHSDEQNARKLFNEFKIRNGRNYNGYDDEKRFIIFKENLKLAEEHQKTERGTAEHGVTQFSDLTYDEFLQHYANTRIDEDWEVDESIDWDPKDPIPSHWDWREHGAVTPAENQGGCGSCWAFATTANIESVYQIKTKTPLKKLSQQQLLDCSGGGCGGGSVYSALGYIVKAGGMMRASDYPYKARKNVCSFDPERAVAYINSSRTLPLDEEIQAQWVYRNSPIVFHINAKYLLTYRGGIIDQPDCPMQINHACLFVGYGEENGQKYWIAKNSWGPWYGENGYFRIARGKKMCGVERYTVTGVIN